ncbi:MAG TPA: AAA family ATPase [Candidatus Caccovicinus merdipullorum]|uniref:AAA family ATPase n=1 Tax=Candidatus Caccovicinus merdipullorum TaxID=2840724 RepID=A0A9D1GN68_9FIRM|nr:AAA family ATPase [Candidatus Caccovicinus merdipullorum]
MKLLDLHINGFGKFHDCSIRFEDGLNVIYGKNEAGKSTLHTFIRAMLFGMERQRGRAARTDQFSRYKPWDLKGGYGGRLRLESGGHVYRLQRDFQNPRDFTIVDETEGRQTEPTRAFMDRLLCGLNETSYVNTISIGQLKSATDSGMVTELKNYIANMNTTGNMALNITKASAFLKAQRKELERQQTPEAARTYTTVLGDIRNLEREISAPEYENHLTEFQEKKAQAKAQLDTLQKEKEDLLQKIARGRQVLESSQFTDENSIEAYEAHGNAVYADYTHAKNLCEKASRKAAPPLFLALGILLAAGGAALMFSSQSGFRLPSLLLFLAALLSVGGGIYFLARNNGNRKDLDYSKKLLQEILSRHLGDETVSSEAMNAFSQRMAEFKRLSRAVLSSQETAANLEKQMEEISIRQSDFGAEIEKQLKSQWELEKKLEHLAALKTQAEGLKEIIRENDRISQELAAIDLAQDTMTELSTSIRDSFGLYLNKEASDLINGITGGIYNSMSVDENLNVFMNTKTKLVPMEQVSSGTMDQIYLALRLAAARLIQSGPEKMPLIFDDSFVLYDDERLRSALKWLASAVDGQIIMFTCHQREAQVLTAAQIPFHLIEI